MTDIYEVYKWWCTSTNERALPMTRFSNAMDRKHKGSLGRKRYRDVNTLDVKQAAICHLPGGYEQEADEDEYGWIGKRVYSFKRALGDLRGGVA